MRSLGGREEVWHLRAGQAEVGAAEKAKATGTLSSGLSVGVEHFDGHRSLRLKRRLYTIYSQHCGGFGMIYSGSGFRYEFLKFQIRILSILFKHIKKFKRT